MHHLPDVNFWIALNFKLHIHHAEALKWFNALPSGDLCHFCRIAQLGFLRLATNPKTQHGQGPCTMLQAWTLYQTTMQDIRVGFLDEPPGLEAHLLQLTQRTTFSPKVWNDAYLAAFALAGGLNLVTFDKGFRQFAGLRLTVLP